MTKGEMETSFLSFLSLFFSNALRVIFSECRESEDSHERSIFLLFCQNIPLSELVQGNSLKFPRFILRAKFGNDRNLHIMAVFKMFKISRFFTKTAGV